MANASLTPNIIVQNPTVRRIANIVVGSALIILPVLGIIEGSSDVDFSSWLPAATQVTAFLAGLFGLAVITPNIPSNYHPAGAVEGVEVEVEVEAEVEETEDPDELDDPEETVDMSDFETAPKHAAET